MHATGSWTEKKKKSGLVCRGLFARGLKASSGGGINIYGVHECGKADTGYGRRLLSCYVFSVTLPYRVRSQARCFSNQPDLSIQTLSQFPRLARAASRRPARNTTAREDATSPCRPASPPAATAVGAAATTIVALPTTLACDDDGAGWYPLGQQRDGRPRPSCPQMPSEPPRSTSHAPWRPHSRMVGVVFLFRAPVQATPARGPSSTQELSSPRLPGMEHFISPHRAVTSSPCLVMQSSCCSRCDCC